ncbi:MAG: porin [Bacteroidota bacterium]
MQTKNRNPIVDFVTAHKLTYIFVIPFFLFFGSITSTSGQSLGLQKIESDSLQLDFLAQTVGTYSIAHRDQASFYVPNIRAKAHGTFHSGFGYQMQADLADDTVLLDAMLSYSFSPRATVAVGAQKSGISAEFLTGTGDIDFIDRSRMVKYLVAAREIGVRLYGDLNHYVSYSAGVFNGNQLQGNDDGNFAYAGRVVIHPLDIHSLTEWQVGLNGYYSKDEDAPLGSGYLPNSRGDRLLLSIDSRYETLSWWISMELLRAELQYAAVIEEDSIEGLQATAGYKFNNQWAIAGRYDYIHSEQDIFPFNNRYVAGIDYRPTSQTRVQLDYILDDGPDVEMTSELMMRLQIAL